MKTYYSLFVAIVFVLTTCSPFALSAKDVDVLVVGGGASGVAAGVQSSRLGSRTLIVEESTWLGGMLTAAGVSAIDGNYRLPSGFWGEFRDSLACHYGSLEALSTGWVSKVLFEPSVGNKVFHQIVAKEQNLEVYKEAKLLSLKKKKKGWQAQIEHQGKKEVVDAKIVIDATELGDIAKMVGITYKIGMDSKHETGEDIAPEVANNIVQDLTYVATLKDYGRNVMIERPIGYDSTQFACAAVNKLCITPKEPDRMWQPDRMITYGRLPNKKYMINWPIEGNDYYLNLIELSEQDRNEQLKKAKNFTMNFIYFLQKELGFVNLGLADDEYPTDDLMPFIPYHRESRRIDGEVRFDLNHMTHPYKQKEQLYRTSVAVGDYPVDHHHTRYEGYDSLPNLFFHSVPSYGLPLGTLIPQKIEDFIVAEKSISVTNIVNGATRLQPVVLQIGQVAGVLANLAIKNKVDVRKVSVRDVQNSLLENGGYLLPYLDVEKTHENFKVYQRIGATGILEGEGRNVQWSNETWLRIEDPVFYSELQGLTMLYPSISLPTSEKPLTYADAMELLKEIGEVEKISFKVPLADVYNADIQQQVITRGAFAIMIDRLLDPFNGLDVTLKGEFVKR